MTQTEDMADLTDTQWEYLKPFVEWEQGIDNGQTVAEAAGAMLAAYWMACCGSLRRGISVDMVRRRMWQLEKPSVSGEEISSRRRLL